MVLSVIIPIFNMGKYVERTLDSVTNQNFDSIEIIVVNDGSTDNSLDVVKKYQEKHTDKNVKMISICNSGVSNARNVGLDNASGDYVLFLDGDDCLKNKIIYDVFRRNKDFDICFWGYEDVDEVGNVIFSYSDKFFYYSQEVSGVDVCRDKINRKIWICTGNACYKKSMLIESGVRYECNQRMGEDFCFIVKALVNSCIVCSVNRVGLNVFVRQNSVMHKDSCEHWKDIFVGLDDLSLYILNEFKNYTLIDLLNCEYQRCRMGLAKHIICRESLFSAIELIKRQVPCRKTCNINFEKTLKNFESFVFDNFLFLYVILCKVVIYCRGIKY